MGTPAAEAVYGCDGLQFADAGSEDTRRRDFSQPFSSRRYLHRVHGLSLVSIGKMGVGIRPYP